MTEIVIAYARPDLNDADRVIAKLEGLGFQVRRDEAGKRRGARRVSVMRGRNAVEPAIVLWSRHYALARLRGAPRPRSVLAAARLDASPLSFLMKTRSIDLRAWRGRDDHRGWKALLAGIRGGAGAPSLRSAPKKVAAPAPVKGAPMRKPLAEKKKKGGGAAWIWLTGLVVLAASGAAAFVMIPH